MVYSVKAARRAGWSLVWAAGLLLTVVARADIPPLQNIPFSDNGVPSLAPLVQKVTPAVVNIAVRSQVPVAQSPLFNDPFFRRFFNLPDQSKPLTRERVAVGSGVIVDAAKGYVLTNNHVIDNATDIVVRLKDRREFHAKLIGRDSGTDIALLKINAKYLTALPFGNSGQLHVGDFVIAIGNPFGLGQTVTSGIVSALGRSGLHIEGYEDFIQTDASINPGNSGGALVNLKGQLVGINTAIIGPGGGNVGIGFAVPSNMAQEVMKQLIAYGSVKRGRIGVVIQDLTPSLAQAMGVKTDRGAVVSQVEPGSPAARGGLKPGDIITAVNGQSIRSSDDLRNTIGLIRAGSEIDLMVLTNGQQHQVKLKVGEASSVAGGSLNKSLAGAQFADAPHSEGVKVTAVKSGSTAQSSGLHKDDLILAVNRHRVRNLREFRDKVRGQHEVLALTIRRGDTGLFIVIQ